jgi:thiamine kinase-like enzyme
VNVLKDTIPDFHNLDLRCKQFEDSLQKNNIERKEKAGELIAELKQRKQYDDFYNSLADSSDYPKRVMHHDAKVANILFSKTTGKVICPIDFDTTMPGYFFSDLGDMIRSMACSHDETSTDFENITIRKEFYDAIVDGYLSVMDKYLTALEKKNIHYAGIIIIYMQALRFMTDYLNGDIYYKTTYPEQNFDRAKNQLVLLQKLEGF